MITKKPWGQEEILEQNDKYVLKRITMNKGCKCSLQYHKKKRETIYILSGKLSLYRGWSAAQNVVSEMYPGTFRTIENGLTHRMEGIEDTVYLEASTPELDDVIRLEDDYNRV